MYWAGYEGVHPSSGKQNGLASQFEVEEEGVVAPLLGVSRSDSTLEFESSNSESFIAASKGRGQENAGLVDLMPRPSEQVAATLHPAATSSLGVNKGLLLGVRKGLRWCTAGAQGGTRQSMMVVCTQQEAYRGCFDSW